jgi:hypothetical protein
MIDLDKLGIIAGSIVAGAGVFYRAYQLTAGKKKTPRMITEYSSTDDDDTKNIVVVKKTNGTRYVDQGACHVAMDELKDFVHSENSKLHDRITDTNKTIGDMRQLLGDIHGRVMIDRRARKR